MPNLLSADIGGTKTLVELSRYSQNTCTSLRKKKYISADYANFEAIIKSFLQANESIDLACIAIAGPIVNTPTKQTASVTNLPWNMCSESLSKAFSIPAVHFINDFQAMGYAIEHLSNDDLDVLQAGYPQTQGVRAVIGAGTGLGEAILVSSSDSRPTLSTSASAHSASSYQVIATEGGHVDFAANSEIELALYQYLNKSYDHVSYERILSGAGLAQVFSFLWECNEKEKNDLYQTIINHEDPASAISEAGTNETHAIAEQALSLFMTIYGAKAGNLALNCIPQGGLYVSGGIASKNLSFLKRSQFLSAFNAKGRMAPLLETIPVYVITNPDTGLIGATQHAITQINLTNTNLN